MAKSTITREQLLEIIETDHVQCGEASYLARMALAAMDSEPVVWNNGCNKSVPAALRYLAENPRPIGGESSFNTAHLYQLAREIELMAEAPLYRHTQQQVVPDGLVKAVEFYEQVKRENPPVETGAWKDAVDWVLKEACRAAMLSGGNS
ncbi:TPA: hypothetical protein MCA64_003442 [Klebsiella pneumoniae]|nr:hypothetical protein [Klebsiella pneumoniae]HBT5786988.1 hypothetical protein [Klebsiella pneumoniae]